MLLRGLWRRAPALGAALALSLLSLAGIPPLTGFAGTVLVLWAVLDGGLLWLAIVAVVNWVVAQVYYVALVAQIYLRAPVSEAALPGGVGYGVAWGLSPAGTFVLGIVPELVLALTDLVATLVH